MITRNWRNTANLGGIHLNSTYFRPLFSLGWSESAELTSPQVVESLSRDTLEAKPFNPLQGKRQANTSMTDCQHNHHQLQPKINFKTPKHCNHQRDFYNKERVVVSWSMSPSMHSYPLTVSVHTKPLKITKPKQETWNWSESRWHFVLINFDNSNQVLVLNISFLYLYSREDSQNLLAPTQLYKVGPLRSLQMNLPSQ